MEGTNNYLPQWTTLGALQSVNQTTSLDTTNPDINLSNTLLDLYYKVSTTAANLGKPLDRWGQISTCMIEKIIGIPRIDKLRVINLFEADFNMLLKIMWARKCVWQMNDRQVINEGQAGSRPGRRAIDVVVQKEMKYLYATTTRTVLGTIDNDAKSCYDRMICNLSMALSYYYGVPRYYCSMLASNLKNSKYSIKTGLGDSTETYQHTNSTPIHGTGQGSCASPALWLMASSFMMDIMEKYGHGMNIQDVTNSEEIRQFMEGFVDDVSNYANNEFEDSNLITLLNNLQNDGKLWAGLLTASGGNLELSKCFYYLLSWQWDKYGNPSAQTMLQQNLTQTTINIATEHQPPQLIAQRDITDRHKTL
jgi:Reverse transcriptase (RNA-dependent DNA polymerase)